MGLFFSRIFESLVGGTKDMRILMVGLDAAGKVCICIDIPFSRNVLIHCDYDISSSIDNTLVQTKIR